MGQKKFTSKINNFNSMKFNKLKITPKIFLAATHLLLLLTVSIPTFAKQKRIGEGKSLAYQDYMTWIVLGIVILSFVFYLGDKIWKARNK